MAGSLFILPTFLLVDEDGIPMPNGSLTFSQTGTSTLQDTFSDSDLENANDNPVVANASGVIEGDPRLDQQPLIEPVLR